MANYNGARRKTTGGNRNAISQSSEIGGKNRSYFTQNSGSGWGNSGRRPSRSTSDDGWGDVGRRPSNYTSDDLWGPLPSQPAVTENAWERKGSWKNQKHHTNQGKKPVPLVGPNFSWDNDEYPALESRPPVENVWEKRKEKLDGRKAMEPTSMTEEELMIQKAIELSKREAKEEEERRRLIEEEYELQNQILAENPEFFTDFLTPDDLAETKQSVEPGSTDYQCNDFKNGYAEKESIWNYPEPPVETQWPQKQSQKPGKKKKRNKSQSSTYMEEEITTQNAWSDTQNEIILPEQNEYQEMQDNWSQDPISENYCNEADEYKSQYVNEDSDYNSAKLTSTTSPDVENESKLQKDIQPKISKVIDMFGGWGSKNTQNSSLKSSHEEERFETYDDFSANSVSNNEEKFQGNWGKSKEMPDPDENLQFSKNSSKYREVENFSVNEKDQLSLNEEDSWNSKYSSNNKQYSNELNHSLYSHVENNIAASASSSFCNAATNSSDAGASFLPKKSVPKDEDIMNNIVKDYASLAVKCTDLSPKENVPIPSKSKDIFNSAATLLNEDNPKPDTTDFQYTSVGMPQNLSMPVVSQTSNSEIMYSLNNTALAEVSNKDPNENIAGSWNDSNISFPTYSERNEINNSLFVPPVNEPLRDVPNGHENYPVDSAIPALIQQETPFPCQPNPLMGNFMDPNLMMGLNPLVMQQMMMLNNPFFLQQLSQMQMYYTAMSMPFNSPLISPMPLPSFDPLMNNTMGNFPTSNINPVLEQSVESNPSIPPPCYNFENEIERNMPLKSDASITSAVPNVEFENSWLTDLLSEGAAHMDSFIPPPTMPVINPPENTHPAPNVEVDVNIAQESQQNAYRNETIPQNSNCDMKNLKPESSTMQYCRTEDGNANTGNVNSSNTPKAPVPEAAGWGDIDELPKKNYDSWNDDVDGWADEKVTSSKSMINSSRYASRKQAATRQPIRQPRQTSQW